jgi:small subunit ribosomal protein S6
MLFIVHPNYEQERLDTVISSVHKEITAKGGTLLKTDNWGKRKLAYLINKQRYGSFVLLYFETDPAMIQGLQEWMEIQAQVLHQIIIRLEEKPELSDVSENPDTSSSSSYKKADRREERYVKAPVKEVKKETVVVKEEAPVEEVKESPSASSSAKATDDEEVTADVPEAVVAEEAPVEEVKESPSASSSAKATDDEEATADVPEAVVEKEVAVVAEEDLVVEETTEEKGE